MNSQLLSYVFISFSSALIKSYSFRGTADVPHEAADISSFRIADHHSLHYRADDEASARSWQYAPKPPWRKWLEFMSLLEAAVRNHLASYI